MQHGNKNNKGIITVIIVIYAAHVEGKNKSDTGKKRGNWNLLKITQTLPEPKYLKQ